MMVLPPLSTTTASHCSLLSGSCWWRLYSISLCVSFICCWKGISGFVVAPPLSTTTTRFIRSSNLLGRMATSRTNEDINNNNVVPKLIVLDLDNTVWTPELYQLRKHQRTGQIPIAGKDVTLFPGAISLFQKIRDGEFPNTKFAVASRTKSVDWAHDLLTQFQLRDILEYIEIFPGNKQTHFQNLQRHSNISYKDMLFFDDARDGKYGNCVPVSSMGVLSVHCPSGLITSDIWKIALQRYETWDQSPSTIIEWDGSVTTNNSKQQQQQQQQSSYNNNNKSLQSGIVKMVHLEKRFGFIQPQQKSNGGGGSSSGDVFFHFSVLSGENGILNVQKGDQVQFRIEKDPKTNGKFRASTVQLSTSSSSSTSSSTISMRTFSMNMPFAALLANGYKTLESRNGTMFQPYPEGTHMLLHVGRRTYPDGNRHLEILKDDGLSDDEIHQLKSLPSSGNFGKGMIVAILEIGKTYDTTVAERSTTTVQRQICAYGSDSGRRLTEIKRVEYLKQPIPIPAQGGIFHVPFDPTLLPDGWTLPTDLTSSSLPQAYKVQQKQQEGSTSSSTTKKNNNKKPPPPPPPQSKQPIYSISG